MTVLIIGSGGREHALAWAISKSPTVSKLYVAPGNGGTADVAENVPINATDTKALMHFVKEKNIDLTIVGPEAPLMLGIVDDFRREGLKIFGPKKKAAQLEGSKAFAKSIMQKYGIPTAASKTFTSDEFDAAIEYLETVSYPVVLKADGLAAGKGVVIPQSFTEAASELEAMMKSGVFGDAGKKVVIEEFMQGEEASLFVITDGKDYRVLPAAQDHKRIFDNDEGKNTGGMGAYAPAPIVTPAVMERAENEIIYPMLVAMQKEGCPYTGFLYVGLMIKDGVPRVVEFNARFGDPEAEAVLPLLETNLLDVICQTLDGNLKDLQIKIKPKTATTVILASAGYPDAYPTGKTITGQCHFDNVGNAEDVLIFHAGTKLEAGKLVTSGGRVLAVTALADTLATSIEKAYETVAFISFDGMQFRKDIGKKGLR
jgi:phosphoribosylamine--glycine ligase